MAAAASNTDEALKEYREAFRFTEDLTADTASLQETAKVCAKLGEIHIALASNSATTNGARKDAWQEAKNWYERSLTTWKNLQNRGKLEKRDAQEIQRIEDELKKCTTAPASLK
jgi:Ser/Thr protein kinase RdoA (MazF antagonist)